VASRYRTVIWAESAEAALDEVVTYIAQDSRDQAIKVLIRTLEAAASLQTLADRGRIVPELRESDLRELFVFRYRLMYRVAAEQGSQGNGCLLGQSRGARSSHSNVPCR
jgi:toxin ParE1/3/4